MCRGREAAPLRALFHRLEAANHCFDSGANLLVLLQQVCAFSCQYVLTLLERTVLVLQLVAYTNERIDPLFEASEFVLEAGIGLFGHGLNIVTALCRINRECNVIGATWSDIRIRGIILPLKLKTL